MRGFVRRAACFLLPTLLAACGGPAEPRWAPQVSVDAARYVHDEAPSVALFTVRSTATGSGAHAGLMISGSQRVLFDPAGTFTLASVPERNDVHYGITPRVAAVYVDYHARETYDVEIVEIAVTRAEADALIAAVEGYGAVPRAQCTLAVTRSLRTLERFETMPVTWFPNAAARSFAALPGAEQQLVTDNDADANHGVLIRARDEIAVTRAAPVD